MNKSSLENFLLTHSRIDKTFISDFSPESRSPDTRKTISVASIQ